MVDTTIYSDWHDDEQLALDFVELVNDGNLEKVIEFISLYGTDYINMALPEHNHYTGLHFAVSKQHDKIVEYLLSLDEIDANARSRVGGITPFHTACSNGHVSTIKILLKCNKIDPTFVDYKDRTPLFIACANQRNLAAEILIAEGIDLGNLVDKVLFDRGEYATLLETAQKVDYWSGIGAVKIEPLIERLMENEHKIRCELRMKLGGYERFLIADAFAVIVFLCDGLLKFKEKKNDNKKKKKKKGDNTRRFFSIAQKLPMELQMILCHRIFNSSKQNISFDNSEDAFKVLGYILTQDDSLQRKKKM